MTKPIFVLNGPNLNLLGAREPLIYGRDSLDDIRARCQVKASSFGLTTDFRQSNHEGVLIDWIQEARLAACAVIINPGAYSHTSVAIHDALKAVGVPIVECHLSNPASRESFRHQSYVSLVATGVICGLGALGYDLAIEAVSSLVTSN